MQRIKELPSPIPPNNGSKTVGSVKTISSAVNSLGLQIDGATRKTASLWQKISVLPADEKTRLAGMGFDCQKIQDIQGTLLGAKRWLHKLKSCLPRRVKKKE